MAQSKEDDGYITVGTITGPHGIAGEVRIKTYTEDPQGIAAYGPLITGPGGQELEIESLRPVKGGVAARIKGVGDRSGAEQLRGLDLYVSRDCLPALESDDDFYIVDLIGLRVEQPRGHEVGCVEAVHNFGAGDILEIGLKGSAQTVMVPFTSGAVPAVEIAENRIETDWPELEEAVKAK